MDVKILKRLCIKGYQIICYLILVAILVYASMIYFEYQTDTNAAAYTPIRQQLPTVSLCFDLSTLIFRNASEKYYRSNYPSFVSLGTSSIFKKSPPVGKLLKTCSYRLFKLDTFWRNTNATECTSLFNITRYQMQGYMCYKLQFAPTKYSFYLNTNSVFDQRKLFKLEIKEPFDRGHIILPILHFSEFPYSERMINQEIFHPTNGSLPLSYTLYDINKLPWPYNTKCKHGPPRSECYDVCRDTEYSKLNYSHVHRILPEEQATKDLKVAYFAVEKPGISKVLYAIRKECGAKCASDSCRQELAITHVSHARSDPILSFMIETAHFPVVKVVHIPKFPFEDFCLQCFSWAGIFISFSILSLISVIQSTRKESPTVRKRKLLLVRLNINKLSNSLFNKGYFRGRSTQPVARLNCSNKKIRRRLVPFLVGYALVTFVLLLWQLSNVISNFFLFETTWKFNYLMEYNLKLPNTAMCLSLEDLMNLHYKDLNQSNYHSITTKIDSKLNLTLAEMLSRIPGEEVLSKCRFRDWKRQNMPMYLHHEPECSKMFKFEKIFAAGKICYIFYPRQPNVNTSSWRLALNPVNPRAIYSLMFDFSNTKIVLGEFVIYLGDTPPHLSKRHSVLTIGAIFKRMQFLSYSLYETKLLPPPYDTRCSKFAESDCKRNCYGESVKKISRLSHNQIYSLPLNERILQYSDLTNRSTNEYWLALEKRCFKQCQWSECELKYSLTILDQESKANEFELVVTSSQKPTTTQLAIARVSFYDLFYGILCTVSFWFGFSLLSFDRLKRENKTIRKWNHKLLIELHRLDYLFTLLEEKKMFLKQMEHQLLKRRFIKRLPSLICAFGCIVHIAFSLSYFQYPTILDTIRKLETETSYTLTICIDSYLFFAAKVGAGQGPKLNSNDFQMFRPKLLNMSIAVMFKKTPDEKNIIALCRVWGGVNENLKVNDLSVSSDRLMLFEKNGTKCLKYFKVRKSFIQSKICYSFSPKVELDWNRDHLDTALHAGLSGYLYMIALNSSFVGNKFSVIATTRKDPFGYSSIWSSEIADKFSFSRWHIVSYTKYIQRILPPPYSDGGFTHMMHMKCIDLCINNLLEPFNKSLTSIFTIPSRRRLITFADRVKNDTFNTWLNERTERCEKECVVRKKYFKLSEYESETEFMVTSITKGKHSKSSAFRRGPLLTSFYFRRTDEPVVVIVFKAQISFFEFLITLGSIISIWFGLSIIGLPHSLMRQGQRSVGEITHELQIKIDFLSQLMRQIPSHTAAR